MSPDRTRASAALARLEAAPDRGHLVDAVAALARAQDVAGLLHGAVTDALRAAPPLGPAGAAHALAEATASDYGRTLAANLQRSRQLRTALDALDAAGIRGAVLKGAWLVEVAYGGDPGRRPMVDVDVLVEPRAHARASETLARAGIPATAVAPPGHHVVVHAADGVELELHRGVARDGRLRLDAAALLARARTFSLGGRPALGLSIEDALVHLAVHLAEHAYLVTLRWIADLAWLCHAAAPPLDWSLAAARATDAGARVALHRALRLAADLLWLQPPAGVVRALSPGPLRGAWLDLLVDHRSLAFSRIRHARAADLLLSLPAVDSPAQVARMVAGRVLRHKPS